MRRWREGCTAVMIPLGAIEQHGPHLALSMDADHADALGERDRARAAASTLVAPTIKVGCSLIICRFRVPYRFARERWKRSAPIIAQVLLGMASSVC